MDQRITDFSARHTFSAKERDAETGLSYFGARYYSSDLSIWLSIDPMSDKYPSTSPYAYCRNNPIMLIDPNGEFDTRSEARQYRKEHHTGGKIKRNSDNDNFSGKYSIENRRTGSYYTKTKYNNADSDSPIYGLDEEGVVCGPLIQAEAASSPQKIMASTIIVCAGMGADDATVVGIIDDPLIPVVLGIGTAIAGSVYLFQNHQAHKSKSNWNRSYAIKD